MAPARRIFHEKRNLDGGFIREGVIWELPESVPGSTHRFKYRLFFGRHGKRLIGYDNERGKGDHRHYEETEKVYAFADPYRLIDDFYGDIDQWFADHDDPD